MNDLLGEGNDGDESQAAVHTVEEPYKEAESEKPEEGRFTDIASEQASIDKKISDLPLEDITRQNDVGVAVRETIKTDRLTAEGKTPKEIRQIGYQARINTRDTGVHDFLQKSKIYDSLVSQYQFQLNVLPATKKILNAITKIGGYQIKEIRDLQARIILAQSAQSKPYQQEFSLIVADASESYIKEVERFSEMIGNQLENTSRKKETLIEQIDDIEYKASDRADIAISLTEKIQEYNSGITECRTAIAEIKKRGRGDYSEEDSQALSMYEAKMKEFQHGIKIFNRSIRESDKDLIHYDAKLDSKQELLKQHESVEGDQLDAYGTVIGNIERARAYLGNGDVDSGFHEIFETMNELQDLNNGLVNILGAYNQHFAKESTQIREFKTGKMNASQESDMQSRLETNGRTTQDLREKYKTKEDQIP